MLLWPLVVIRTVSFFPFRIIARIKRYLSQANIKTLIHVFVTCELDHCNSLLIGLPCYLIKRLQMVQNCAARLVVRGRKYDPVTSVLCQLHWLPIEQRIVYKILLLTYKALNGLAPYIYVVCLSITFLCAGFDHLIIIF